MHDPLHVGFIGLGIMGEPMALNVLKAGFPLAIYNRTPGKAAALQALGARVCASPAALAEGCQVIVLMVTDTPDVRAVVTGPAGVIAAVQPGSVVIDMSTVTPDVEIEMAAALAQQNCAYLDAPVSGGDVGAKAGTLAIMVGGDPMAVQKVDPVLRAMGKTITHCGPVGSGQVAKLCNQILVSTALLGVCEALALAQQRGLPAETMLSAVQNGAAGSWQLSNLGPKIAKNDFDPGFMIDLMQKDLRAVLHTAQASHIPLPATSLVHQLFTAAQAYGDGRAGTQALAKVLQRLARKD